MRLINYLNEISFKKGRDIDYPLGGSKVIVFNKNDSYKLEGKTHGDISHALKHMPKINPSFFKNILSSVRELIKDMKYYIKNKKGTIIGDPEITDKTLINTMDRINDKIVLNEPLTDEEKQIQRFLIKLKNEYISVVDGIVSSAINVDDFEQIDKNKTICFSVKDRGKNKIYFLDTKRNYLLITSTGMVAKTFFIYKNVDYVKRNTERVDILNKEVENFIKGL